MSKLYVAGGNDPKYMTHQLLEAIQIEAGWDKNASIGLKPNLVVEKDWRSGATTNPAICEAIIEYLFEHGFKNVFIIESAWVGADTRRVFKVCGYDVLAKKYGIELVDVKKDKAVVCEYDGLKVAVSQRALNTDYLINLPLIKGHCQTKLTCALKNLKGLITDKEKRRFHALGLDKPIAYLNKMIYPALTIADGTYADQDFEEGGNPVAMNTMIASTDSVLLDTYAADMLGYTSDEIGYLRIASDMGIGSSSLENADIVYINSAQQTMQHVRSEQLQAAKSRITQKDACSACYSNLVSALIQMEDDLGDIHVCVGQGFKRQSGDIGCGNCTSGFDYYIKGCPPNADDIKKQLMNIRRDR